MRQLFQNYAKVYFSDEKTIISKILDDSQWRWKYY